MTILRTRVSKGAALTHGELDTRTLRVSQTKAANYTVSIGDNRDIIEVTATATITLPDAVAIIAASDTGDFEVTIKVLSGTTTITRLTGGDTIDGVAGDLTLESLNDVTLKVNQSSGGYNIISGGSSLNKIALIEPVITTPVIDGYTHYQGSIAAGSLGITPSGWTSVKDSNGKYTITHNFGDSTTSNTIIFLTVIVGGGVPTVSFSANVHSLTANSFGVTYYQINSNAFIDGIIYFHVLKS